MTMSKLGKQREGREVLLAWTQNTRWLYEGEFERQGYREGAQGGGGGGGWQLGD